MINNDSSPIYNVAGLTLHGVISGPNLSVESAEQAVENGIAYLNKKHPNWFHRIDLETLDVGSCEHCILTQLFGGYRKFAYRHNKAGRWLAAHGFMRPQSLHGWGYIELTRIWKQKILELRGEQSGFVNACKRILRRAAKVAHIF